MTIIPDLPDLSVEQVDVADVITLTLRTTAATAACPVCGTISTRIQSRYTRTLRDLPASGRPLCLVLHVRRFFCRETRCARTIFAEPLPELCHPHAQRTLRLQKALCQLGLESGGQVAARLAHHIGFSGSRDTILRLIRRSPIPTFPPARIVGLDDFAWRRGRRYGTLICDLEQGWPIAMLPDRSVATVSAWLHQQPSIEMVSRDGSAEYAAAITQGAPQATQISDRWHLVKNLMHCVSTLIAHQLTDIRRIERAARTFQLEARVVAIEPLLSPMLRSAQRARQVERTEQYTQIMAMHTQGMRSPEIATAIGLSARTVRRWLAHGTVPSHIHRWHPAPRLDPYKAYLLERWQAGCHNRVQLFQEVQAQGYHGSLQAIYTYFATHPSISQLEPAAHGLSQPTDVLPPHPLMALSVRHTAWLLVCKPDERTADDQHLLVLLRQASPSFAQADAVVTAFLRMVRERTGEMLEPWLAHVQASHLEELAPFVARIRGDQAAVTAGLTLPWNNGSLEGHVNRLKLFKRQGYGRAKFDLLRRRVLRHAEPTSA